MILFIKFLKFSKLITFSQKPLKFEQLRPGKKKAKHWFGLGKLKENQPN